MSRLGDVPLKDLIQKFYQAKNASKDLYLFFSGKTFEEMIPAEDIFITIYSILAITGFIANLTMILIVLCSKSLRNMPYNILLLNLLVSNILMAIFCIPFTLIGLLERNWTLGWFLCKTIPGIQVSARLVFSFLYFSSVFFDSFFFFSSFLFMKKSFFCG